MRNFWERYRIEFVSTLFGAVVMIPLFGFPIDTWFMIWLSAFAFLVGLRALHGL